MSEETTRIYYPYDEVRTTLIPVAEGCPYNRCTFCAMYKGMEYREVPMREMEQVLLNADTYTEKVFLTGADPLFLGYDKVCCILKKIKEYLPYCACVACYASIRSISKYSLEQLQTLRREGLGLLYIGFESGSDEVLAAIWKGHTSRQAVEQAKKLNMAKISFHTIVMYGIAGQGKGVENAIQTAEMVSQFRSNKIVTMNYTVFEFSKMAEQIRAGEFVEESNEEKYEELRTFLEHLSPDCAAEVDTTHPTNIIKMREKLPHGMNRLLERCRRADK